MTSLLDLIHVFENGSDGCFCCSTGRLKSGTVAHVTTTARRHSPPIPAGCEPSHRRAKFAARQQCLERARWPGRDMLGKQIQTSPATGAIGAKLRRLSDPMSSRRINPSPSSRLAYQGARIGPILQTTCPEHASPSGISYGISLSSHTTALQRHNRADFTEAWCFHWPGHGAILLSISRRTSIRPSTRFISSPTAKSAPAVQCLRSLDSSIHSPTCRISPSTERR